MPQTFDYKAFNEMIIIWPR